jgi:adenylate cyclase
MKQEIERKFLLKNESWKEYGAVGTAYKQAYLSVTMERTIRVRIAGDHGYLTIKGPTIPGKLGHAEYEYEIPLSDAEDLFNHLCEPGKVEKTRYKIPIEKSYMGN